jgi:tetraacyldisaccharide 4'-kinase
MTKPLHLVVSAFYRIAYKFHHKFFLRPQPQLRIPVVIVGSYLAGGAGKTPFTIWLANFFQEQSKKVAILCHNAAWDEINLLKTQLPSTKVIVTKNRYITAKEIQNTFDIIICDDGFEDTRFTGAIRFCLDWQEPPTSWTSLLPSGPFRSLKQDHNENEIIHLDCFDANAPDIRFTIDSITNFTPGAPLTAEIICGLGAPKRFIEDVHAFGIRSGIAIEKSITRPDHDKHFSQIIEAELSKNKDIIISQKDACRLPQALLTRHRLHITIQKTTITNRTMGIIHDIINKQTAQPH